ncbi:MAG: hypothetical protein ACXW25_03035, partial [Rhodospirillales bacterium]
MSPTGPDLAGPDLAGPDLAGPDPAGPGSGCLKAGATAPLPPLPLLLVAAVAMVDVDGRVLIAQRPAGKAMAGLW